MLHLKVNTLGSLHQCQGWGRDHTKTQWLQERASNKDAKRERERSQQVTDQGAKAQEFSTL